MLVEALDVDFDIGDFVPEDEAFKEWPESNKRKNEDIVDLDFGSDLFPMIGASPKESPEQTPSVSSESNI